MCRHLYAASSLQPRFISGAFHICINITAAQWRVLLWDSSRGGEELTQKTETGRVDRSAACVWIITTTLLHECKCCQTNRDIWEPPEAQRRNVKPFEYVCCSRLHPKLSCVKGDITNPLCSRALTPHSDILLNGLHTAEAPLRNTVKMINWNVWTRPFY